MPVPRLAPARLASVRPPRNVLPRARRFATFASLVIVGAAVVPAQHGAKATKPLSHRVVAARPAPARKTATKPAPPRSAPVKKVVVKKVAAKRPPAAAKTTSKTAKPAAGVKVAPKRVAAKRPLPTKAVPKTTAVKAPAAKLPAAKKVAVLPLAAERKAVQAKYDAMSLLVMRRDGKRLAALLMGMTTPDFVYRDKKGRKQSRTKLVNDLRAQMKMVSKFKRSGNRVAAFALRGAQGSARVVSDFAMVFPNGKKWVTVVGQSTTEDTWVKTSKGWKLRSIRTLRENVKYNGKPM